MCENVLYRTTLTRKIYCSDKVITVKLYLQTRYGIPSEENYKIDIWTELLRDRKYTNDFSGYEDRKGRLFCEVSYGIESYVKTEYKNKKTFDLFPERVYKDRFKYMEGIYQHKLLSARDVRMKDLINELNAEEFILFLKDNEINYIPNIK